MKFLIQILVFTLMFLSLPGVYSQAQTTEPQDPETKEELSTERDEPADTPDSKEISKPKAIYNYFKSHYDGGLVFESKNGNFRIRARTRVQLRVRSTHPTRPAAGNRWHWHSYRQFEPAATAFGTWADTPPLGRRWRPVRGHQEPETRASDCDYPRC